METAALKKFAQSARKQLLTVVKTKLELVLKADSPARRESPVAVEELEKQIKVSSKNQVIEQVAYIWFNRFCALRFMDINRYTPIGIVSPAEGNSQPEILLEAKQGVIDEQWQVDKSRVMGLLGGTLPSSNPQAEAYQLLLVAACNSYHDLMPFLFEKIADYTELLIPDDLLSENSVLTQMRDAMTTANCSPEHTEQSVEVIGWLYQFYISEKKDDVFAALKKGKKITPENIPAATQLFTPHWIVRYLVENSLGRLWMLNHPDSRLIEQMDYYIRPEDPTESSEEGDFLRISSPEEIKICDPACGSGHMLTYAFDLLYAIYEEQGYQATDIPRLILTHNLYGIEIDQRAGALAAFALTMKAREKYRRFLTGGKVVQPNICVLENISIDPEDLSAYMDKVGRDLFSGGLQGVVNQWEEADNFGALIRPLVTDVSEVLELLRERQMGEDLFLAGVHQKVLKALRQADYLSPKYHVVVANPPYMVSKNANGPLKSNLAKHYSTAKADIFCAFIERATQLCVANGYTAKVTMQSWMFLSSFVDFRISFSARHKIVSMAHLGSRAFDSIGGEIVATTAFVLQPNAGSEATGIFIDLTNGKDEAEKSEDLRTCANDSKSRIRFKCRPKDFSRIPGSPIAYWVGENTRLLFEQNPSLEDMAEPKQGLASADNDRFLRLWHEVSFADCGFGYSDAQIAKESQLKWFPIDKGGEYRKWYGNQTHMVNWRNDGYEMRSFENAVIRNDDFYFLDGITWTAISSSGLAVRHTGKGNIFSNAGMKVFAEPNDKLLKLNAFLNSNVAEFLVSCLSQTLNFDQGIIARLPIVDTTLSVDGIRLIEDITKRDWDSFEFSWDFSISPLFDCETLNHKLGAAYAELRDRIYSDVKTVVEKEEHLNAELIANYGLNEQVSPSVPIRRVTLFGNTKYRYGSDKSDSELEALLLADTMREFISYAVGCMLGRYSLDQPGLILANQGETADDYRQQIPEPTFAPDEDNVIPLLDGDWFEDDITERFKAFLKVTFGTEHYEENLTFLENSLFPANSEGKKRKTIRDYFLKEFYNHHIKLYKKRPIYWLFSSPKGTFNALIYMHRYRPDTVSVILNDYLRDFQTKLRSKMDHLQTIADSADSSARDKASAVKEVNELKKKLKELEDYERETLYPLATKQIAIDLDDGVKVNYRKFGKALKKVTGLSE